MLPQHSTALPEVQDPGTVVLMTKPILKITQTATFYIVRHGRTEHNEAKIIQGQQDSKLTSAGREQAENLAQELRHIEFDAIFSSDLLRARHTAEILKLERQLAVQTTAALRERKWGRYEGRYQSEFLQEQKELLEKFATLAYHQRTPELFPEGIEPNEQLMGRVLTFLRETAVAYAGKTVLMVSHGGMMRVLLLHLGYAHHLRLRSGSVANTAYIKLASDGVDFEIQEVRGVHLAKREITPGAVYF